MRRDERETAALRALVEGAAWADDSERRLSSEVTLPLRGQQV
jgi:hypothetical protein